MCVIRFESPKGLDRVMMDSPGGLLLSLVLNRAHAPLLLVTGLLLARATLVHVYILLFLLP